MTVPRAMQINFQQTRYYHVVSRCVRRAFLCGIDKFTGQNFDHRKEWLIGRVKQLSSIFSIQIASYAILSNHFHLTLYADTEAAQQWSDDEVITRWGQLFPGGLAGLYAQGDLVAQEERAVLDAQVPVWRERLADISWYMKCLNEFIARRANAEDHCKGRLVSRPREFHPQPLPEPDVTLSRHPAPAIEPWVNQTSASRRKGLAPARPHV